MLLTVCIKFEFVSKRQIQFPAYLFNYKLKMPIINNEQ